MNPLIVVAVLAGAPAAAPTVDRAPEAAREAERLVGLLDYVAGDYAGAVKDGRVVKEAEFREQLAFLADAQQIARSLGLSDAELKTLAGRIEVLAPAEEVALTARRLRDDLVARLRVAVIPALPSSRDRAAALYTQLCAKCHGPDGKGDTPEGRKLEPPPRSFNDASFLATASPRRAYHALTFGLGGTAMASFEALPPEDRLSLAFFVFTFSHAGETGQPVSNVPLRELALRSDAELRARVDHHGLAWLRNTAPWTALDPIEEARQLARAAAAAAGAGHREPARRLALDAYLQGFEAAEGRLQARDPAVVAAVEAAFVEFRATLDGQGTASGAEKRALLRLETALDRASNTWSARAPHGSVAFFASFVIFAREGIEAALLIAALLAVIRRSGHMRLTRWVHAGWLTALLAGIVTWFVTALLLARVGINREALEGIVSLMAAAVLFYVSFWLLAKSDSRRWLAYLRERVDRGVARGSHVVLFTLAFVAVYREAFETTLFYRALLTESQADHAALVAGLATGALAVVIFAWFVIRLGARLPFGAFFGGSGTLLCLLTAIFAGKGLAALRAAGWLQARPVHFPEIPWLGIYDDWISLAVQSAVIVALLISATVLLVRRARNATMGPWSASASGRGSSSASPS